MAYLNLGLDFSTKNNRLSGSIEYYFKKGIDLIGDQELAPSAGYLTGGKSSLRGNFANMKGHGVDLQLTSKNIQGAFNWYTSVNFSYAKDEVTRYDQLNTNFASFAGNGGSILPFLGRPVYSLYSYRWAGLDPDTGDPRGYLNNEISKDYNSLNRPMSISDLVYEGPSRPPFFGGLNNRFSYKRFTLMFNVSYKFGYYFRRSTLAYNDLFGSSGSGHEDYNLRWQAPGDEATTSVPSMIYPASAQRDTFYSLSEATVDRGDHIRLQDISISCDFFGAKGSKIFPRRKLQAFAYVNNVGILWKANNKGLDPDFAMGGIPYIRTIAVGIKAQL